MLRIVSASGSSMIVLRPRGRVTCDTEGSVNHKFATNVARKLTIYALTLFSSTAKVFMASCIRSKLVDFQTKSTIKLWVISVGTPSLFRSSSAISSETSKREPVN